MKKLVALMLGVAVLAALVVPGLNGVEAQDGGTILDVASTADGFSVLATAVSLADPSVAEALSNPDAQYTVFAPNDDAFTSLPELVVNLALSDQALLTTLLTYHVVEGKILAADIPDGETELTTLQGGTIKVVKDEMGVRINSAHVILADVEASNGVIHGIDAVIIPEITLPEVSPADFSGPIVTAGSSTVAPLTIAMANRWEGDGAVDVPTVDVIGTGAGFERFCESGETDISNASRGIREEEVANCTAIGRTPLEFRVGTDALAITVSAENDFVTDLTLEQLAAIFSGTAKTWADVDPAWPAEAIELYSPGSDSGTYDYFVEEVLEDNADALNAANPQFSEDDNVLVEGVSGSPFAIGYFGYAYYLENRDKLKVLSLEGVVANDSTVDSGAYPLARPLFIYSDATIMAEKPQVAAFINYYLTNVPEEIGGVGYFPPSSDGLNGARLLFLAATAAQ